MPWRTSPRRALLATSSTRMTCIRFRQGPPSQRILSATSARLATVRNGRVGATRVYSASPPGNGFGSAVRLGHGFEPPASRGHGLATETLPWGIRDLIIRDPSGVSTRDLSEAHPRVIRGTAGAVSTRANNSIRGLSEGYPSPCRGLPDTRSEGLRPSVACPRALVQAASWTSHDAPARARGETSTSRMAQSSSSPTPPNLTSPTRQPRGWVRLPTQQSAGPPSMRHPSVGYLRCLVRLPAEPLG